MCAQSIGQSSTSKNARPSCSRLCAFTLVELLVVVSIVALLIGILLPAMGRSIGAAKATVCMANLKDLHRSLDMYRTDNRGWLPTVSGADALRSASAWSSALFKDNPGGRNALICPEDPWGEILRNSFTHGNSNDDFPSSYGLNDFIVSSPDAFLANLNRVSPQRPDDTILLADMGPDEMVLGDGDLQGSTAPSRNFGRLRIDDGFQFGQPPSVEFHTWLSGRHSGAFYVLSLMGNVKRVKVDAVLKRDISSYYAPCADKDCTVCIELDLPHYSFHESNAFWWTGSIPVR